MNNFPRMQTLLILFLLCLSNLQLLCSADASDHMYFINCGSVTNIVQPNDRRVFVGDLNSSAAFTFTKHSSMVDTNPSTRNDDANSLYKTARVFMQNSSYKFDIKEKGIYILRIHFFAFPSSSRNLSGASFSVAASSGEKHSAFSLLSNFSMANVKSLDPLVEEYLLDIEVDEFLVYFIPEAHSFAFVNAIEVLLSKDIYSDDPGGVQLVNPQGSDKVLKDTFQSSVFQTVHRINAGGQEIKPDGDVFFRRWIPDDRFLVNPNNAETGHRIKTGIDDNFAPYDVVWNARVMKNNSADVSWSFEVPKNARHFLRAHFFDVVGISLDQVIFNLSIYKNFRELVDVYNAFSKPVHQDYIVDSDEYGFLNISIFPQREMFLKSAYLNGLEIMDIRNVTIPVPDIVRDERYFVLIVVGGVLAGLILLCILVLVIFLVRRQRKLNSTENSNWTNLLDFKVGSTHTKTTDASTCSSVGNLNLGLRISFAEIKLATENFDKEMMLGKGGFGIVYKGTLRGKKVAVKRSEPGSDQGLSEFQTEIMMLSKIRHRHLVSLIGYCDEYNEMILVYEYVEKGTLREHLYGSNLPCLSWKQRLEICIGAARGIHYLHSGSAGGIIHRDVKSTNILLDENLVAKVADFGLSKAGSLDQTHITTCVKGTFGYLDPEYFLCQQLTEKSDVYSFGVVLLEVLCARQPIDTSLPREQVNLADWGLHHINKGLLGEIVDPMLAGQTNPNSVRKFGETTAKCLEEFGTDRPSMSDVLWDLEYALQLQQTASHGQPNEDSITFVSSELSTFRVNEPSFTTSTSENHMLTIRDDDYEPGISEVFSELKNGVAR